MAGALVDWAGALAAFQRAYDLRDRMTERERDAVLAYYFQGSPGYDRAKAIATYERMLEKGPERFQVKPGGLPAMDHLYEDMPNFTEVLDDVHAGQRTDAAARERLAGAVATVLRDPNVDTVLVLHVDRPLTGATVDILEDPSRALTIGDVTSPAVARPSVNSTTRTPVFFAAARTCSRVPRVCSASSAWT